MPYIPPTGTGIESLQDARKKALTVHMNLSHSRTATNDELRAALSELARLVVALVDEIEKRQ